MKLKKKVREVIENILFISFAVGFSILPMICFILGNTIVADILFIVDFVTMIVSLYLLERY